MLILAINEHDYPQIIICGICIFVVVYHFGEAYVACRSCLNCQWVALHCIWIKFPLVGGTTVIACEKFYISGKMNYKFFMRLHNNCVMM